MHIKCSIHIFLKSDEGFKLRDKERVKDFNLSLIVSLDGYLYKDLKAEISELDFLCIKFVNFFKS